METTMHKGRLLLKASITCASLLVLSAGIAYAQAPAPTPFSPQSQVVKPFGYGTVYQSLVKSAGQSGTAQCLAISRVLKCLSVSGGNSCSASAPVGEMVSCGSTARPPVDETAFQPLNCHGNALGDGGASGVMSINDFCLTANYMPQRTVDTIYQYNDYVRVGINRRFGGMIMELYGTDKVDRIMQNPGGGQQLSLMGFSDGYAPANYERGFFAGPDLVASGWLTTFDPTAFLTMQACQSAHPTDYCSSGVVGPNLLSASKGFPCGGNGGNAGSPYNPIQGQSANCEYGAPSGRVDNVSQPITGEITITKANPNNFRTSTPYQGLSWSQTTSIPGPFALTTYNMLDNGQVSDMDFQEIPAIFLHNGLNATIFWYSGNAPYQNSSGPVSQALRNTGAAWVFQLPNRQGPFSTGASEMLTEDWVSSCDQTGTKCVTIASFSSVAQDIILQNGTDNAYAGIRGFFSLTDQLNKTASVAIFPYRFDAVVGGMTVRQWIYNLRQLAALRK